MSEERERHRDVCCPDCGEVMQADRHQPDVAPVSADNYWCEACEVMLDYKLDRKDIRVRDVTLDL